MAEDLLELARAFAAGRSLKRGETIQLVKDLLALADAPGGTPAGIPSVSGYDGRPPIVITTGPAGAVFLGPNASRWYTRSETRALAGALARAAFSETFMTASGADGGGGGGAGGTR